MKIVCGKCSHSETVNLDWFIRVIGGAMPAFGFYGWVTFLFAGTGMAMGICIAIATGGIAMLVFKNEIVEWIINKGYKCPKCKAVSWEA